MIRSSSFLPVQGKLDAGVYGGVVALDQSVVLEGDLDADVADALGPVGLDGLVGRAQAFAKRRVEHVRLGQRQLGYEREDRDEPLLEPSTTTTTTSSSIVAVVCLIRGLSTSSSSSSRRSLVLVVDKAGGGHTGRLGVPQVGADAQQLEVVDASGGARHELAELEPVGLAEMGDEGLAGVARPLVHEQVEVEADDARHARCVVGQQEERTEKGVRRAARLVEDASPLGQLLQVGRLVDGNERR